MFGIINYGIFILSAIVLNLTPGSDTMYILGNCLSNGRKAGILSALGISGGCFVHTFMAALGLSVILSKSAIAFDIVKYLGTGYLIYLGIRALISKASLHMADDIKKKSNGRKILLQGMMTNVLNPKVALFFLAFLPQFIGPGNQYGALPFLLLGLTFIATGTIWCMILAIFSSYFAGKLNAKFGTPALLNKISGIMFIGLGLNLLRAKLAR